MSVAPHGRLEAVDIRIPTADLRPDVSRCPAGDAHQLVERGREDVVRVPAGGPDLVEVAQVDIDDRAQGSGVADRCYAAYGFCNPSDPGSSTHTRVRRGT